MATVQIFLIGFLGALTNGYESDYIFPDNFMFGVTTSAYQIEGAWNANGKGLSFWDNLTHKTNSVANGTNGDIACNSYYKYREDVKLLNDLGVDFYRFSLAWSRILPNGKIDTVNPDGIRYYNNVINEIIKNNITPMVTLYHWDIPMKLHKEGGFNNEKFPEYFADFAELAFKSFGDRIKYWFTFNDPNSCCSYVNIVNPKQTTFYECSRNLLRAHGKAYKIYDKKYRSTQNGKVAMAIDSVWYEPFNNEADNIAAAERYTQFMLGIWAHPIYHGDYPEIIKTYISDISHKQNLNKSRLSEFAKEEIEEIRGSHDLFALNHYTTKLVEHKDSIISNLSTRENDASVTVWQPAEWLGPTDHPTWLKVVPLGLRKCLKRIKENYNNPEIYITENGFKDVGQIYDFKRIEYHELYLKSMLDAMNEDGVAVKAYAVKSLIDSFEWLDGYKSKFGLYQVDFNDPDRPRKPKSSALYYKEILSSRSIPNHGSFEVTLV